MKNKILSFFISCLFIIALSGSVYGLIYFITDDTVLVIDTIQLDPQSLIQSKNMIKQFIGNLNLNNRHQDYSFSHSQIEHLLFFLAIASLLKLHVTITAIWTPY